VTRRIWLASYPKSGNTWFRMLAANLFATDKPVDINELPYRGGIAGGRGPLDHLGLIDSGLLTFDEIDDLRPRIYEELARGGEDDEDDGAPDTPPVRFVKVHDAYTRNRNGEPMLGGRRAAEGAILIVRDPRDVAASWAHHNGSSIDKAIAFMNDKDAVFGAKPDRQDVQLRQVLLDWSGHTLSWLEQTDLPLHLIRYEDLLDRPEPVFRDALTFAKRQATDEQISRAIAFSNFAELQRQESEKGFSETPRAAAGLFFRHGRSGGWRDELTPVQIRAIEAAHGPVMQRLGYELCTPEAAARTQAGEAA